MNKELVITVNGLGKVEFISIFKNEIDEYITENSNNSFISIVKNGDIKDKTICFNIKLKGE